MRRPFSTLTTTAVPLLRDNVDTDAIIPSREMRTVGKTGLADGLFANWRYTDADARLPDPTFLLNQPGYATSRLLMGGANFGCGSSREHAVWALSEYGFRAIIADSFSPIFRGNCVRNGVVPIELDPRPILAAADGGEITVDLPAQEVRARGETWTFIIDAEAKTMLTQGLDPIALTLLLEAEIDAHDKADRSARAWAWTPLETVR